MNAMDALIAGNEIAYRSKSITRHTRKESYKSLDEMPINDKILAFLEDYPKGLTARELAVKMYNQGLVGEPVRQATAPRLTTLADPNKNDGVPKVVAIGYKKDFYSGVSVAIYTLRKYAEKEIEHE